MEQADITDIEPDKKTKHAASEHADRRVWMLKRQSSATNSQFVFAFGIAAGIILGTSGLYVLTGGPWQVLPMALIEVLVFGGLCWLYAKRERGYDCLELFDDTFIVLQTDSRRVERHELNPLWTQVGLGNGRRPLIEIRYAGTTLSVGAQVPLDRRQRVVDELSYELATLRRRGARQARAVS